MHLFTHFEIPEIHQKIKYESRIALFGSCFSDMIGNKLSKSKFNTLSNPYGTIFNPISLIDLLHDALHERVVDENLFVAQQELWVSYGMHAEIKAESQEALKEKIVNLQEQVAVYLKQASHLFLTFGTAYVYALKDRGHLVANCHKRPGYLFKKRLLVLSEMKSQFRSFYLALKAVNPNIHVSLTVSPVRHTKDGIPENQLSKCLLRVLCHEITQQHPEVHYFPSYEIMMDELRDYRFYKDDLIHPSDWAEDYIFQKFLSSHLSEEAMQTLGKVKSINLDLAHRPFHPKGKAHLSFLQKLLDKMEQMPVEIDFSKEILMVKAQISNHF
ncbi:GSCFA domain-containing protein [Pararhodonellum marinum]|uniref:GSCFA domain-containing protein n=1 Tax=Pararhodonellum marinum TaxID=2755358 RepID=UPI0018905D69|nr:GSCFA domain-containing protein [Pararhodonellum marinum]